MTSSPALTPTTAAPALSDAIAYIRQRLQHYTSPNTVASPSPLASPLPPSLAQLCHQFHLSPFERDILLLCAGVELEADFAPLCAIAQADAQRPYVTFSLALAVLAETHWQAFTPQAPLRRWRFVDIGAGNVLTSSPLRLDEQILHYLMGDVHLNQQLVQLGAISLPTTPLVPSHAQLAEQLANTWYLAAQTKAPLPVLQLCSKDSTSQRAIAAAACEQLNLKPYLVAVTALPLDMPMLLQVQCLWEREYWLNRVVVLLEWDELDTADPKLSAAIAQFIDLIRTPVMLLTQTRQRQHHRPLVTFEASSPTKAEQRSLWETALSPIAPTLNGQIEHLVSHFNFSAAAIHSVSLKLHIQTTNETEPTHNHLWQICRTQSRPRLDELAERIEATVSWDDLVLPEQERQVLRDVAIQLKHRTQVYEQWGFGDRGQRGLGISALFAGASGTGKTLAAEVLANALQLDLYRIDLSAVVSKYIGETEKNLGRVFDAADVSGVILLFDEADSLFGKRSEVKDSHDRYANMEVSYLLQRMEAYRGLAILTTNLKGSIDQAFLRRIRFIVQFPFPDATQRAEIWRRVFPNQSPTQDLDPVKLAKLNIAGGNIRNIALNAAFIAAADNQPIQMTHLLQAARSEYVKLERPLTDTEVKGWVG
jgi:ATP-dependent 26S proteasome regulatory subunit